jgi:hypothetical protein
MIDILHLVTLITYHLMSVEAHGFKMLIILQVAVFSSICCSFASDCDTMLIKDVMTLYMQGGCTPC